MYIDQRSLLVGGGNVLDERGLRLAAVAHVALEALALAGGVVALAAAAALVGVVVGRDRLLEPAKLA